MDIKNPQLVEPDKNFKQIWPIIIAVVLTAAIVGATVFFWQNLTGQANQKSLQQEIATLNQTVTQLQTSQEVSDESLKYMIPRCGRASFGLPSTFAKILTDNIIDRHHELKNYINQGYGIREICFDDFSGKYLLSMDSPGLDKTKPNDNELSSLEKKLIIGVTDSVFEPFKLYPVELEIENYNNAFCLSKCVWRSNAQGASEIQKTSKIIYICMSGTSGSSKDTWFAYNIDQQKNIKVKDVTYWHRSDPDQDVGEPIEKIFNKDLVELLQGKACDFIY